MENKQYFFNCGKCLPIYFISVYQFINIYQLCVFNFGLNNFRIKCGISYSKFQST